MDGALAGITRGLILDPASELNTHALEPAIAACNLCTADNAASPAMILTRPFLRPWHKSNDLRRLMVR